MLEHQEPKVSEKSIYDDCSKLEVLVAEDDEANRNITQHLLSTKMAFGKVHIFDDGDTALAFLEKNPQVDIALIDRMMPRMDGLLLYRHIRQNPNLADLKVVFQTGKIQPNDLVVLLNEAIEHVVPKPFTETILMAHLRFPIREVQRRHYYHSYFQRHGAETALKEAEISSIDEILEVSARLALNYPDPMKYAEAIHALLENGMEHGVCGVFFLKDHLLLQEKFTKFIEKARAETVLSPPFVHVKISGEGNNLVLSVRDDGKGMKCERLRNTVTLETIAKPSGRGIPTVCKVFDLSQSENVNALICHILK